jgi:hypothetical protein
LRLRHAAAEGAGGGEYGGEGAEKSNTWHVILP